MDKIISSITLATVIITITVISIVLFAIGVNYKIVWLAQITPAFYNSIITALVGFVAFTLYKKQKDDQKKDAANIILLEIESADKLLKTIKENLKKDFIREDVFLMPVETWNKNKYLFVRDFDGGEWERITDFYNYCKLFDKAVEYNNSFFHKNEEEIRVNLQRVFADYTKQFTDDLNEKKGTADVLQKQLEINKQLFESSYMKKPYIYSPMKPINDAKQALDNVTPGISQSSIGDKLKKIAGLKK